MNNKHNSFFRIIPCLLALVISHPAQARFSSYLNMSESRFENLTPFPKWTRMMSRFESQQEIDDSECDNIRYHPCAIIKWKELIEELQGESLEEQMDKVNEWGNKHPYIVDQLNWGMNDYWETPYEFMEINGDCEDYAIAKYYSLRALGVSEDKLRIIIVQDLNLGGIIHAILGVFNENNDLIILDNQIKQVIPALKIYHYRPIYGVNEDYWYTYRTR